MKNLVIIKYLVALFVCGNSLTAKGQLEDFKINASEVKKDLGDKVDKSKNQLKRKTSDTKNDLRNKLDKRKKKLKRKLKKSMPDKRKKTLYQKAKEAAINNLFPAWPVPDFDWGIDPVAGFEARSFNSEGITNEVVKTELGIYGNLKNVPFDPNNPGVLGHFGLGGTFGAQATGSTTVDGNEADLEGLTYKRFWGSAGLSFLYNHFKNTLTIRRGLLEPSNENPSLSLYGVTNDFGVLIYSWISGHYTLNYDSFYKSNQEEAFLTEVDHWLHTRIFTSMLKAYFNFGPGFTDSEQNNSGDKVKQFTTYILTNAGFTPFWKLAAKARAKYVLQSSGEVIESDGSQLPDQALNEPLDSGIPADSMIATGFAGFENIWGGFGFGYQVNLTILNVNEKDGRKKSITRQQGLTLAYTAHY